VAYRSLVRIDSVAATRRARRRLRFTFGVAIACAVVLGLAADRLASGLAVAGVLAVLWLVGTVRMLRVVGLRPRGPGGRGPGPAGVREPRRPKPPAPAGALALPLQHGPSSALR
jgi:hypothetical protein